MNLKNWMTAASLSVALATSVSASTLVINSDASDPAPKAAWGKLIEQFKAENPDIDVKVNEYDHEGYKQSLRNWLVTSPPDVVYWYAGNRMKFFVDKGLFDDVSDLWQGDTMNGHFNSAKAAMSVNGKQWGVPYSYYQWGMYYNKNVFDKYGLSEPKTWDEFLQVAKTLKSNGVTPFTIGTKYLWTAAGWFDYLNMRVNGLDFHIDLMDGKVPYTDARVRKTFETWAELVEPGYFLENHASYSWQEAQPFLFNGDAAMYLMGNFLTPNFPNADDFGFFQFPMINSAVGMAEDAPMDTLHIPSGAKNKADARKFLEFVARADVQTMLNEDLKQLPPNADANAAQDSFLQEGSAMLASASGTAQFYDRDTTPDMASEGMKAFQEFMVKPERLDAILERLERTRQRVFGN